MKKRDRIIYWVATIWLCLGMTSSSVVQLIPLVEEAERMTAMGYPLYFLTIIGVWKLLGVVTVLIPKFPLVKEWAYAGFFFLMTGAILSHFAVGDPAVDFFGPTLLLVLSIISWYFRPLERKLIGLKN
ncbi:DoxX family protein [Lunatibacter salilacus]|uniref:DoxX family protein n=1 Tax=Lunatibacter salilacus TaxID=2483804 RepID=UPI00131B70E0|nr:DoxX family protein [Lunatibacter salilacus]